jgi:tRNA A37 threonylcarbamoyladenosine dehydratase
MNYETRFGGISRLFGISSQKKLANSHVCIIGLGGVGSWAVEALARSGVGELTLIDMDEICVTNTNRQLHALEDTIGKSKGMLLEQRVKLINPDIKVNCIDDFLTEKTLESYLSQEYSYILDCIDGVKHKCDLINYCYQNKKKLITVGAAGGKQDPTQICVDDLSRTINDMLLTRVRKKLRQNYRFPRGAKKFKIMSVYSKELAYYPQAQGEVCQNKESANGKNLDCETGLGTATFFDRKHGLFCSFLCRKRDMSKC